MKLSTLAVSEINEEYDNASVCGVIVRMSPVCGAKGNPSIQYFTSEISDGKKTLRFICYSPELRPLIEGMMDEKKAITIENCSISQSTYVGSRGKFEILSTAETKVFEHSSVFDIKDGTVYTSSTILHTLDAVKDAVVRAVLTVSGKIVRVEKPYHVQRNNGVKLLMQECTLADSSIAMTLNIWEDNIRKGIVKKGSSYTFINVKKKEYDGIQYLSTCVESEIIAIKDIGEVSDDLLLSTRKQIDGEIIAVDSVMKLRMCPTKRCSGKVNLVNDLKGNCNKCKKTVRLSACKEGVCAKFTMNGKVGESDECDDYDAIAFSEVLNKIIGEDVHSQSESEIECMLLNTTKAKYVINEKSVVIDVVKPA